MDMGYFRNHLVLYPRSVFFYPVTDHTPPSTTKKGSMTLWSIVMLTLFLAGLVARFTGNPSGRANDPSLVSMIGKILSGT